MGSPAPGNRPRTAAACPQYSKPGRSPRKGSACGVRAPRRPAPGRGGSRNSFLRPLLPLPAAPCGPFLGPSPGSRRRSAAGGWGDKRAAAGLGLGHCGARLGHADSRAARGSPARRPRRSPWPARGSAGSAGGARPGPARPGPGEPAPAPPASPPGARAFENQWHFSSGQAAGAGGHQLRSPRSSDPPGACRLPRPEPGDGSRAPLRHRPRHRPRHPHRPVRPSVRPSRRAGPRRRLQ